MRLPPHSCVVLETARPRTLAHGSFPLPDSKRSTRCDVAPDLMLRSRELQNNSRHKQAASQYQIMRVLKMTSCD